MFRSSIILLVNNHPPGVDLNKSVYYYLICNANSLLLFLLVTQKQKVLESTSGAGTAYPPGAPEFTPDIQWGSCYSIFSFICMFCRSLFVLFLLVIMLSVLLRYTILITSLISSNSSAVVSCICFIYVFYLTSGEQFDNKIRRDDDVRFELDKHAQLNFCIAISLMKVPILMSCFDPTGARTYGLQQSMQIRYRYDHYAIGVVPLMSYLRVGEEKNTLFIWQMC